MKLIFPIMIIIFTMLIFASCMSVNHQRPEPLEKGKMALDLYVTNYAAPAIAGNNILSDYSIGWQFGIIPRLGITPWSEIGLKLCLPEILFYYKHRVTPTDFPVQMTLIGELGLYSELPNFNQTLIFYRQFGTITPYGGIKNIFIMGMEGAIFDLSYKGDLFLSGEWKALPWLTIILEYNYTFFWKAFALGAHGISLGISFE
ncbi:MAG: hypothetical protein JXR70_08710 [Spirochaetales bacterium]|nr:hypothetical protein [Spirochaetales bacterium]